MKLKIHTQSLFFACLLTAVSALPAADPPIPDTDALASQAETSVAAFASALKSELAAAMQAGGPIQAIDVCHTRAPEIATAVSGQQGVNLSRVSLRNRNPENAPTGWQAAVLDEFQARLEAGEAPGSLAWQQVVANDGGREFRFMKAIPTQPVCLACHGESIAPPVMEKLAELYPGDQATGYREGDIRGAFVVTRIVD